MKKFIFAALLLGLAGPLLAAGQTFRWLENGIARHAIIDPDTRASITTTAANGLTVSKQDKGVRFYRTDTARSRQLAARQPDLLPVLREGKTNKGPWLLPVGGVVVRTQDEAALAAWAKQQGLSVQASAVNGYWLVQTAPGEAALKVTSQLLQLPGIQTAAPNWSGPKEKR